MSLTISKPFLRAKAPHSFSVGSSAWRVLSRENNLYTTVALLLAAGDHMAGDFGHGAQAMQMLVRTVTTAGADGAGLLIKLDTVVTPSAVADADIVVSGAGQQLVESGPFLIVWVYQLTAGDVVKLDIQY